MLTLKSILAATPDKIKARARKQCFAQVFALPKAAKGKASTTKSGGYIVEDASGKYREFKFRVKCTDGWRKVALRFYGPMNINTKVWVWCSCPYFKYNCEVALASKGSSAVVQSNGQRPRFTNPRLEPRVCKHCFTALAIAMRRRKTGKDDQIGTVTKAGLTTRTRQTERAVWRGDSLLGNKSRVVVPDKP